MDNLCSFCHDLEVTKANNEKLNDELWKDNVKLRVHYMVSLVEIHDRLYKPKYSKSTKLQAKQTYTHQPKGFYYCPLCGRKIKDGSDGKL